MRSRITTATVASLFALACGAGDVPEVTPGELVIREAAAGAHHVGRFLVSLERDADGSGARVAIRYAHTGEHEVWGSGPGRAFLMAGRDVGRIHEARGMVRIEPKLEALCADQEVRRATRQGQGLRMEGVLTCDEGPVDWTLTLAPATEAQLRFEARIGDGDWNRLFLAYRADEDERFFGFGEQFSHFDLSGHAVPIAVSEQGIGRGLQPLTFLADLTADGAGGTPYSSYAPIPHYVTSAGRSLFLENEELSSFDLREPGRVAVQVAAREMVGRIVAGDGPRALIQEYTRYAGRMRPLPEWVMSGAIVGMQGGTDEVARRFDELDALGVPMAAFWLQDWVGQRRTSFGKQLWWSWKLDRAHYPCWEELVAGLRARGVRVMTYVNPFLVEVPEERSEQAALVREARDAGYLVEDAQGDPYPIQITSFSANLLDLSNPDARAWIKGVIQRELAGSGASGWMSDFGEGLPFDAKIHAGSAAAFHNRYPVEWAKLNREAIEELPNGDEIVFFSRSGYTRSPRFSTLFWLGDQLVSFDRHDGLRSAITGLLSGGISGMALNHSDLGGYTTLSSPVLDYHRSRELLLRWMELAAFSLVFRTHEGNDPEANHQFHSDPETARAFARLARIHRCWLPLRRNLVEEAARTGLPVHRHPFLHDPEDATFWSMSYEAFLLGDEILVAPVTEPGVTSRDVYLPAGRWIDLWSGRALGEGERGAWLRDHAAPLGRPPVFLRGDWEGGASFRACVAEEAEAPSGGAPTGEPRRTLPPLREELAECLAEPAGA